MIDTHAHLYLPEFIDINEVIIRAKNQGIQKIYLPCIDSETIVNMIELESKDNTFFSAMIGLHPCSVKKNYKEELSIMETWLNKRTFSAIGEIGLDFYWDTSFKKEQYDSFETQMHWAVERKLPIAIHTRNAMDETIAAVKPYAKKEVTGIFHCFSGNKAQAFEIMDMGFYLGIGGVITYKNSGLAEVIKSTGIERLVVETDAPYLTPVPFRGKRNESAYLPLIVEKIAEATGKNRKEVEKITTENAQKIFGS